MPQDYRISLAETSHPGRLVAEVESVFARVHPGEDARFVGGLAQRVEHLFRGDDSAHEAIDMAYHNLEHTLQTVLCLVRMYEGSITDAPHPLTPADFRRALAAMFFHDTGYLKERGDKHGTGAKYTFVHEARSAELAAEELGREGWTTGDIETVRLFIQCTGPSSRPDLIPFRNPTDAELGAMVCTADFLGQMSDPNYLAKLPALYREFEEAYEARGLTREQRPFTSPEDLIRKTPSFWRHFVIPKLTRECRSVYRHLARPPGSPENPYLQAVEAHIRTIESAR